MHHDARATRPKVSKKFFVSRLPGRRERVDPDATAAAAPRLDRVHERLADAHLTCFGLDVDVVEDAEHSPSRSDSARHDGVPDDGTDHLADGDAVICRLEDRRAESRCRAQGALPGGPYRPTLCCQ